MTGDEKQIWFHAKRYGWDWGLPVSWEGWMVYLAFAVLLGVGAWLMLPGEPGIYGLFVAIISGLLIAICRRYGEKPGWRWGDG